ncbi:MAG: efflux RND transporter permease subunit, partial [candidate division Zixibacteria bacterium]|nr:efflux RND transporter permease subunit [candidate division Zixibacteria bacterium]
FKERLQTVPGVSEVRIYGEKRYAMRLWIDPQKLAAYRLSPLDVRNALSRENVELPSGRIEGSRVELAVRTLGLLSDPEDFNNLILREEGGKIVRFRDVGVAVLGIENERSASRGMRGPRVAVAVVPQPGSNHIAIANEVYRRVEQIKRELPPDLEVGVVFDTTRYIRAAVAEVVETIFIAFLLVLLIIFLFLRDWRTTIIPIAAIPVSLVGAFFIMDAAGFSINVLTLLGLVLAIGLVVDDAIVMLENIYTKVEAGREPVEAGLFGSREVFFAIISTTIALVAVFMPIVFLEGLTGRLFKEFGIVLGGAVVISAFVALTLTPMLATKILRFRKHSRFYEKTEPFFQNLGAGYRRSLDRFMSRRWLGFVCLGAAAALVFLFAAILPKELAPLEDRSRLRASATAPEGTSFEEMDGYFDRLIATAKEKVPEMEELVSVTGGGGGGVNSGFMFITLATPDRRERSQAEIHAELSAAARQLTEARAVVSQEQTISVGGAGRASGCRCNTFCRPPIWKS